MNRLIILILCMLGWGGTGVQAQNGHLPERHSVMVGGGVSLPHVEGNKNDFFSKNGNRAGYDLLVEGRYYLVPQFALGVQYDYLRMARLPDKVHLHFLRPNVTFRYLWSDARQGAFIFLGVGYMNYQERTYKQDMRSGHLYQKGYCGISAGLGYEFHIAGGISGVLRADVLTADWFANPEARLFNPDGYEDGVNHSFFRNNLTFFNVGMAVQWGK